jgi:hypothetical protein
MLARLNLRVPRITGKILESELPKCIISEVLAAVSVKLYSSAIRNRVDCIQVPKFGRSMLPAFSGILKIF